MASLARGGSSVGRALRSQGQGRKFLDFIPPVFAEKNEVLPPVWRKRKQTCKQNGNFLGLVQGDSYNGSTPRSQCGNTGSIPVSSIPGWVRPATIEVTMKEHRSPKRKSGVSA